jgi:hypothetical protein
VRSCSSSWPPPSRSLLIRALRSVDFEAAATWLNGSPAVWIDAGDGRNAVACVAVEEGRIARVYLIANPHKLARLDTLADLTRTVRSARPGPERDSGTQIES